ncbi:hypothetical protein [Hymenobacter jejuensis]|uniref:Uncharacterized protein n=1 Tax=Hymenobacter jejuensis TaxID=2502781 RepID=A0A5B7ZYW5_9BACT|nr:hypothetical protein [Hymenobacter jejuensis]QDA59032.1 hypothetical protein FHG12_02450 [Hymenobacter jejuensis]
MNPTLPSPFSGVRTCVLRRYLTLRYQLLSAPNGAAKAAQRARKRRKKQAKQERLRNFFAWCAGFEAYGSIF